MQSRRLLKSVGVLAMGLVAAFGAFLLSLYVLTPVQSQTEDGIPAVQGSDQQIIESVPTAETDELPPLPTTAIADDLEVEDAYVYDPKGRRDPFVPPDGFGQIKVIATPGRAEEGDLKSMGLESFDIEQLRLVGIMWDVNKPKAMLVGPEDQVFLARPKQKIGRNGGYVAIIREGELVVVEPFEQNGKKAFNTRILELSR